MTIQEWSFSAFDTWFFREARPFNTATSNELTSLFPPSPRTIMGAIRTAIGDCKDINWTLFNSKDNPYPKSLQEQIGNENNFGTLKITGSYLIYNGERLYPVPAHFMVKENQETKEKNCTFLEVEINEENKVQCDLGNIILPKLNEIYKGAKPLENCWVTFSDMELILNGQPPSKIIKQSDLFKYETRIGIGRDNENRAVKEGQLYRTKHLRLIEKETEQLKIGVLVEGLEKEFTPKTPFQMRFGGEGRMATININKNKQLGKKFEITSSSEKIILVLLTAADFNESWIPCSFEEEIRKNEQTTWIGEINGVKLEIISAVIGKAIYEGGWDLKNSCPRSVKSLVPAGSVYFCRITNDISPEKAIEKLQGFKIGKETELGRGELAIGVWK